MSEESFDSVMSINVKGTLNSYRAAARQMIKQGPERGGRIVGMSSIFGLRGTCSGNILLYQREGRYENDLRSS